MDVERLSISVRVSGKVQGVGYRSATMEKAQNLKLKGWVKNEADGSVSLEAEGEKGAIDELIKWLAIGPSRAVVLNVEVTFIESSNDHAIFEVRY